MTSDQSLPCIFRYSDRPEVLKWQQDTRVYAFDNQYVNTMLGRRRQLPGIRSKDRFLRLRAERAAINTPIQGSAADVASAAMLAIAKDEWLQEYGWKLLLQVHDEVSQGHTGLHGIGIQQRLVRIAMLARSTCRRLTLWFMYALPLAVLKTSGSSHISSKELWHPIKGSLAPTFIATCRSCLKVPRSLQRRRGGASWMPWPTPGTTCWASRESLCWWTS